MRSVMFLASLASALAVGVLVPGGALSAAGGSHLPVKGSISGTFTFDPLAGRGHIVGGGEIAHFGRVAVSEDAQYVFTGPTTFLGYFDSAWTAANGDQLFLTGVSDGTLTDATHATEVGDWTATSGTGRFANATLTATGSIHVTFTSPVGGVWTATVLGELNWGN